LLSEYGALVLINKVLQLLLVLPNVMRPVQVFCDFAFFKEKHHGHHIHRILVTQLCFVVNLYAKTILRVALGVFLKYRQELLGKKTLRSIEMNEFLAFGL
jgi:hypothetical protein